MKLQILKTGLIFLALNLILVFNTNAQVGIGTTTPKSSLQIEGNPGDTTTPDGVQVPSLTITQLEGKIIGGAYGADQDGAIVYISDASIGSSILETADIENKGFYYYFHNGVSGTWRVIGEQKIDLTNPDRVPRWDGTNLIEGSIIDSGGNVGIGTLTPDALLDVEGSFQFKDGSEGNTKLLTSDSDGNASWQSIKPESFLGTGNASEPDFNCISTAGSLGIGLSPILVTVSGNYAYVVDQAIDDLKVIDVSNPESPVLSGSLGIGSSPWAVAVSGNYAYVVDSGSDDLKVIDVSSPASPILSGTLGIGSNPWAVAVSGNYAYVVDLFSDDLKVINVSNPSSPILSGTLGIGAAPVSVAVSGNYAYVVDYGSDDLKVIEVSNPSNPILSGSLGMSNPIAVAVSGNYAYVVDSESDDLKVIDVSNPVSPTLSGALVIGPVPRSVAVSGNYAYVVDQVSDDLKVIDVSNPASPLLSGSLDIGTFPRSVAVSGNYAYVVDQDSDDLKIIKLSCTPSLAINPLTGDFETVTESDPKVASSFANVIPKWDGTKLVDGTIIDSGGNVGIGITPTSNKFEVDGDVRFSSATNTTLTVQSPDNSISLIRAFGNNQGSGAIEVGQANTYGGGISYNGDLSPSFVDNEKMDHITFYRQNNGVRSAVFDYSYANDNVNFNGNITTPLLSTGHGFNELYAMDQNVRTTDAVSFNGGISWNSGVNNINNVTGSYGSVQVNGGGVSGWEGFSINGRAVFMHDGSTTAGIYDDANNHWIMRSDFNGSTDLYYDGSRRLRTALNSVSIDRALEIRGSMNTTSVSGQTAMEEQIRIYHPSSSFYYWSIGHQSAFPSSTDDDLYFYVNKNGTQNVAGVILDQNPTTTMNFTGQHRTLVDGVDYHNKNETESLIGLIVVADNNEYLNMSGGLAKGNNAITIDEALPIVSLSSKAKDKSVFGVISVLESEDRQDNAGAFATPYEKEKGDERFYINSVGEGGIWIIDSGQPLESGDFIQTSDVKGYGMRQDDDLLHNYTVAKITMDCDFEPELRMKKQIKRIANEDGSHENVLDQFGRVEWEPMLDQAGQVIMELPYKIRYLNEDGETITKEDYDQLIQDGKKAYRAAFVGCTYHCG